MEAAYEDGTVPAPEDLGANKEVSHEEALAALQEWFTRRNFDVYGPRAAVLRDESEKVSKGGIIIPDQAQRYKKTGSVVAIGQGYEKVDAADRPHGIVVGKKVMFNSYDGVVMTIPTRIGPVNVLLMHVSQLYAGYDPKEVTDGKAVVEHDHA